ncbi:histone methyltransferase SET2 [Sugiyamaella lignohabitans]|uniref:Histone-lysine N-methyltransferase, H3 lysine-36 specific n=1 Tax=Sugiyamaella lignohabitans TaxID=796027 RepID=A0A167EAW9_9ASCO|nr:histone methyltransferase SET2 [Sugiyamaella lignohabitans]ANB13852.1 histone methyltransferase SET2 [Sugiyamaella lignohabitans]
MSKISRPIKVIEFSDSDDDLYGDKPSKQNGSHGPAENSVSSEKVRVAAAPSKVLKKENNIKISTSKPKVEIIDISNDDKSDIDEDDEPVSGAGRRARGNGTVTRSDLKQENTITDGDSAGSEEPVDPFDDQIKPKSEDKKNVKVTRQLFNDLESKTAEAQSTYIQLEQCTYQGRGNIGSSGQVEAMNCDCREHWVNGKNIACGDDSDCINRLTSIECTNDNCTCGDDCGNQRFQAKQYANVDVIQTELKGYGVRALEAIPQNTFIYEYIGEVIDESNFRQRMETYKLEGIRHFYFMMLQKGEFIDATKQGSMARFCNHSCRPNCYVDKWIVGDKVRMGIFSKRDIIKGEEITFDYNVDRYGTQAQPCYCGESNCIGILGGKTQTEAAATKLPQLIVDVLDLTRQDEKQWLSIAKKFKKDGRDGKYATADASGASDEDLYREYSLSLPAKPVQEESVTKIMSALLQGQEQWLIEKLVNRIFITDDSSVHGQVMRMHGYQVFSVILAADWPNDVVPLMILEILTRWPRLTKNKISSSKIESIVAGLAKDSTSDKVQKLASTLLQEWSSLEMAYRIPRRERGAKESTNSNSASGTPQEEGASSSPTRPAYPRAYGSNSHDNIQDNRGEKLPRRDWGAKDNYNNRGRERDYDNRYRRNRTRSPSPLPSGWETALAPDGRRYYFNRTTGLSSWTLPKEGSPQKDSRIIPDNEREKAELLQKEQERLQIEQIIESANQSRQNIVLLQQQKINELQSIVDAVKTKSSHRSSHRPSSEKKKKREDDTPESVFTRTVSST